MAGVTSVPKQDAGDTYGAPHPIGQDSCLSRDDGWVLRLGSWAGCRAPEEV